MYGEEKMEEVKKRMIKELKVPDSSLRSTLRKFVICIFYRLVPASAQ